MAEPSNTEILVAIAELRGEMRADNAAIRTTVERHGLEIGGMRASINALERQAAKSVTWTGLGGLLAVLIPVMALFATIVVAAAR